MCGHDDYLVKFIWCLRSSAADAGDAHNELADLLESEYKDMLTRQVSLTEEISKKTIYDPRKFIYSSFQLVYLTVADPAHGTRGMCPPPFLLEYQ